MMYCERCNIDFSEGLRYCKWCGQTLFERRRQTSELKTCPTCSTAIKPGWAFCKNCGGRLDGEAREVFTAACPRCGTMNDHAAQVCSLCGEDLEQARLQSQEQASTSLMQGCPSCGESIDPGSAYCKACGSPVYAQPGPFGDSALLCAACNSYSPVGSASCRVCNASLISGAAASIDATGSAPVENKPSTLPDLAEHLPEPQAETVDGTIQFASTPPPEVESGAHTLTLSESGQIVMPPENLPEDEKVTVHVEPKAGAKTNVLSGVAGSKSELPPPTAPFKQARITGSVEEEEASQESSTDTAAPGSPFTNLPSEDLPAPFVTRIDLDSADLGEGALEGPASDTSAVGERTIVFGSEATVPPASQPDIVTASEVEEEAAEIADRAGTASFGNIQEPAPEESGTREYVAPAATAPPAKAVRTSPSVKPETAAPAYRPGSAARAIETPVKSSRGPIIASAIVALLVIGAAAYAVWWYVLGRPDAPPQPNPASPPVAEQPAAPSTPAAPSAPVAPEGMVLVEGGTYVIGRDDSDEIESPEHTIQLAPFYIDRTEVSNAEYKKFIDATSYNPPSNWVNRTYPEGRGAYPVTGVTWEDAANYAAWAGKRLPTESEWEAAARGKNGLKYPWGNVWASNRANIGKENDSPPINEYSDLIKEVGSYPQGASPVGALDMIGNVWEWTASRLEPYPGSTTAMPGSVKGSPESYRVMRGGAYDGNNSHNSSYRGFLEADQPFPKVGFRCVKDRDQGSGARGQ
jgi:formylglycine-generating enzyme required for sulfatase activity